MRIPLFWYLYFCDPLYPNGSQWLFIYFGVESFRSETKSWIKQLFMGHICQQFQQEFGKFLNRLNGL